MEKDEYAERKSCLFKKFCGLAYANSVREATYYENPFTGFVNRSEITGKGKEIFFWKLSVGNLAVN